MRMIEPQRCHRCATERRETGQALRPPDKMLSANIATRMKQSRDFASVWVDTRKVRSFKIVTVEASVSQILKLCHPAMKSRNDMIKLEWCADYGVGQ